MAPIPALRFLTLVLFFFTNGQGISARDLKVDQQDEKQMESKDEPYITQYRTTQPNYAASYTTMKHNNHLSHLEKLSDPYTSGYHGYKTSPSAHKASQHNYIAGYRTRTRDSNELYIASYGDNEHKKPNYIAGYRTHTHDSNEPYITSYGDNEPKQSNYMAGYRTHTHDSSGPYNTAYLGYTTHNHESKQPNYIAGYRTPTHESNGPYNSGNLGYTTHTHDNREAKQPNYIAGYRTPTHDSNGPYNTANLGYTTRTHDNHEVKQTNYIAGYRTHTHDSNEPYNTAYLGYTTRTHDNHEAKQTNYIAGYRTHTHASNGPYNTAYLGYTARTRDPNEVDQPYIVGYISTSHDSKAPKSTNSEDSKEPSSTKEDSKDSPSPDMDRTEAFKAGFFTLDDIYIGNVMTLQFPVSEVPPYLSRKEADSIPLSMSELPSVLQLFSIPEDSPEAKSMRRSLEQCENEPITGETKTCANSLESMLEFVDKVIGSDTKHNILTTSYPSPSASPLQKYTISKVSHDIDAPKWVACHPLSYPYAIHYCHFIATGSKVFKVSLVGENNGDKMEALGICHLDTSDWSPDHVIFRQLGIKAGKDAPVCHFFPVKHFMWVPQPSKAIV